MEQSIFLKILQLADQYADKLKCQMDFRMQEMTKDDRSHFLIYQVLGISEDEGMQIDIYQNKGRFLYNYAGHFLEDAARLCFCEKFPETKVKFKISNTRGERPRTFEVDCLVNHLAYEIKWRDATTDGDHITKEHTRIKCISQAGFTPVRLMFYNPNREQAYRVQDAILALYHEIKGEYYSGSEAWEYLLKTTKINLMEILQSIAKSRR